MLLLYTLGVYLYGVSILVVSLINKKAKLWVNGRRNKKFGPFNHSAWFHFASLGEFEQGRPVLEEFRAINPEGKIVVTFFSPSGYEIRKNTPLADAVYYLPLDTAKNARDFIDAINPSVAVFTKYEYWYFYFNELHKHNIPLFLISGIFRPNQVFFKWYGGLHRKMLGFVSHFFLQDEQSVQLLRTININNTTVSGDTRFDRVWANASSPIKLAQIETFKNHHKTFIAGSTWPADEQLIAQLVQFYPDWKFIIAPHEIQEEKITALIGLLPQRSFVRYSQFKNSQSQVLIIDNIGMLSSLYQYADLAYIGGGFGAGIHNTLEAAAFGIPVIFGPNYARFKEAHDLIAVGAGFSVSNSTQLEEVVEKLVKDQDLRETASKRSREYVVQNTGATDRIMRAISSTAGDSGH